MKIHGFSTEGKVLISLSIGLTIGFLSCLFMVNNDKYWKGLNESIIYGSGMAYARGCTELGKELSPNQEFFKFCMERAKTQMKDTRDIIEQEPKQVIIPPIDEPTEVPYPQPKEETPHESFKKIPLSKKPGIWI